MLSEWPDHLNVAWQSESVRQRHLGGGLLLIYVFVVVRDIMKRDKMLATAGCGCDSEPKDSINGEDGNYRC